MKKENNKSIDDEEYCESYFSEDFKEEKKKLSLNSTFKKNIAFNCSNEEFSSMNNSKNMNINENIFRKKSILKCKSKGTDFSNRNENFDFQNRFSFEAENKGKFVISQHLKNQKSEIDKNRIFFETSFDIGKNFTNYFPHNNIDILVKNLKIKKIFENNEIFLKPSFLSPLSPKYKKKQRNSIFKNLKLIKRIKSRFLFKNLVNSITDGLKKFKKITKLAFITNYKNKALDNKKKIKRRRTWDCILEKIK